MKEVGFKTFFSLSRVTLRLLLGIATISSSIAVLPNNAYAAPRTRPQPVHEEAWCMKGGRLMPAPIVAKEEGWSWGHYLCCTVFTPGTLAHPTPPGIAREPIVSVKECYMVEIGESPLQPTPEPDLGFFDPNGPIATTPPEEDSSSGLHDLIVSASPLQDFSLDPNNLIASTITESREQKRDSAE